ncbi:H/ACA ribonucleoprotein complex subunit 2 [Salpingoeca rosetta]|uniref:H/ACA ribonucleoprotein complex subunit 2 n=1 Tax=Salpingoeca rosetta (strain ATCC 50818 / BSB-021) TaxID=946362 RepID=F2TZC8_SALR5|nr:H/ACA ribonucleoprotein complex subunit 2 [Salpingoeca rosetta]EGD78952.1 H/ACA ribonucleoprotein complex subunit 2 [Salpingoeca rosetta]|eukprot:XP_004997908.1 H/ACA ribonucleoprotein complex subunit 2 [Salpingoeca rosetta]
MGNEHTPKKAKKEKKAKKDKKEKKEKKEKNDTPATEEEIPYEVLVQRVSVIAKPLADKKLTKKLYKMVKKAHKNKSLCRGVKEVSKAIRKGAAGICILAGDVSPIDVISHIPVMCEDAKVPYCYIPSKKDLGAAGQTKRPTSVVLVKKGDIDGYGDASEEIDALPRPM